MRAWFECLLEESDQQSDQILNWFMVVCFLLRILIRMINEMPELGRWNESFYLLTSCLLHPFWTWILNHGDSLQHIDQWFPAILRLRFLIVQHTCINRYSQQLFTCKGVSLTCSAQADQPSLSLAMVVQCLSKRVIGSNKLRKSQSACKFRGFTGVLQNSCLPTSASPWFATTREMIALLLFKGATESKELAVPKGSCENRMFGELAASRSLILRCFLGNKMRKLRNFQKRNLNNQLLAAWGCQLHTMDCDLC